MADTDFSSLSVLTAPDPAFELMIVDTSQASGPGQFFSISCNDFAKLFSLLVTDKTFRIAEATGVSGVSGQGMLFFDSSGHAFKVSENGGSTDTVVLLTKNQTMTNKTLTSPTINTPTVATPTITGGSASSFTLSAPTVADFTNATHNHSNAAGGGALANSGVTAGSYKNTNLTVTAEGRISAASNGTIDPFVTLTPGTTVSTDASLGNAFTLTAAQSFTLANPTNPTANQIILYRLIQDSSGSRIMTLDTAFAFGAAIPSVTLSTTGKACDYMTCIYNSATSKWHIVGYNDGFVGLP